MSCYSIKCPVIVSESELGTFWLPEGFFPPEAWEKAENRALPQKLTKRFITLSNPYPTAQA